MLLEVSLDYLVVKVAPTISRKYVIMSSKGNPILYVQIQKVLYGVLRSALLFYRKLEKGIEAFGLQISTYNLCVETR